jgi:hypothetical protein
MAKVKGTAEKIRPEAGGFDMLDTMDESRKLVGVAC